MNHNLLNKLAFSNIKKNQKTLIPFLVVSAITVMVFYILLSLAYCPYIYSNGVEAFKGAQTIAIFLELGGYIVGLFAVIFIMYANNFVMKERRREIGLYGILGLSKKNIMVLLGVETVLYALISVVAGVLAGTALNKLMLLWLYKILGLAAIDGLFISSRAMVITVVLFAIIFTICLFYNVATISLGNPIDLIKSNKVGEKEPKVKWALVVIGVATLALGYYIALSSHSSMAALSNFFNAAILVIIGTFCLFTSGSIFLLKTLKKNKGYYYKTNHFISVSSLMYRMKHNAAGLAAICVLSTAVILLLTCASSLMLLGEQNIDSMYPKDVKVTANCNDIDEVYSAVLATADQCGLNADNIVSYIYRSNIVIKTADGLASPNEEGLEVKSYDDMASCYMLTVEEYNKYADASISLGENEVLFVGNSTLEGLQAIKFGDLEFVNAGFMEADKFSDIEDPSMSLFEKIYVVFNSADALTDAYTQIAYDSTDIGEMNVWTGFNCAEEISESQMEAMRATLAEASFNNYVSFKQEDRILFYNTYGGAFFVGIFLAILFLMATVMIIYYKQMSEGLEDQKRYQILKNIGLTSAEVQSTIRSQVRLLFFLPALTAIVHMIVASNIVRLFLGMILIIDGKVFALAIALVAVVFLVVYTIVYKITSIEYYNKVNAVV